MTTATVDSIAQAAQALLNTAEAALATTDAGPVAQAWLNPGTPAFDVGCDFVCVWMGGENQAPSFGVPQSQLLRTGARINLVTLNVTSGRCLANGTATKPPSAAQKTADAVKHMQDGQALWVGVGEEIANGDLFDGTCKQVLLQGMTAYTPQGGLGGWNLAVVVQIDGYPVSL